MFKIIFFVLAIAGTVFSSSTPVRKCKGVTEDLFKEVVVTTSKGICNKLPCDLISGTDVKTDITFDVKNAESSDPKAPQISASLKQVHNYVFLAENRSQGKSVVKCIRRPKGRKIWDVHFSEIHPYGDSIAKAGNEVEKITLKCNATALGITIDYAIPNAQKGCDMLTNTFCPIEPGTEADLTFIMNVSKVFPKIPVDLVMYLLDQNNKMISCFEVLAKVTDGK